MNPEPNFTEIPITPVEPTVFTPQPNTPAVAPSGSNVTPAPNGSILNGGSFYSPNFSKGNSGWSINAAGDAEFNDGNFRGDITGASGTFSGTITGGSLNIPDTTTADSFHVNSSGDAWWGSTLFATALASISKAGAAIFSNIVATGGTIGGWVLGTDSIKDAAGTVGLSSAVTAGDDIRFFAGHTTPASAPFKVTEAGAVTASSATITGAITIQSGSGIANLSDAGALATLDMIDVNTNAITNGAGWTDDTVANLKRRNFTAEPTTPYNVGDLWSGLSTGDLKVCTTQRLTGAYTAGDWVLASKYTDDSGVTTIVGNTVTTGFVNALNVTAASMNVGGLLAGTISSKDIVLAVTAGTGDTSIRAGKTDFTNTESGFILGLDDSDSDKAKFYIGDATTYFNWNGSAAAIKGAVTIDSGSGIANLSDAGDLATQDVVTPALANLALQGWTQTSVFSVTDLDTVAWAAGVFTTSAGTAYNIGAGNTGNMAARTYVYLDTAVSTTAYQVTTTAATAVGAGKVLIATAINGAVEPLFQVFGGIGGQNINASSLVANSITANELSTSITYAGSIIIDTAGLIRSGQTAYNTGTGWWLGNDGGTPKYSIGDGSLNALTWDGTTLTVEGTLNTGNPLYGNGTDGDLIVSSGTTTLTSNKFYRHVIVSAGATLDCAGYVLYASISINNAGTIKNNGVAGTNGQNGGGGGGLGGGGGAGATANTLAGGVAGVAGGKGRMGLSYGNTAAVAGTNGTALNPSLVNATGAAGGKGCDDLGYGGAAGGTGGAATGETLNLLANLAAKSGITSGAANVISFLNRTSGSTSVMTHSTAPGAGGGGGGGMSGDNQGPGGGGSGGGGGIIYLASPIIINSGTIQVNGGNGGNGGNIDPSRGSGAGGGGGGSGGVVVLIYSTLTDTGTIQASGGAKGTGGTGGCSGVDGDVGTAGKVYKVALGNNFVA